MITHPVYSYSLCIALPLMLFFGFYFIFAPVPVRCTENSCQFENLFLTKLTG